MPKPSTCLTAVYVVKQIKGWDGRELLDPFEVFVSEDGEIYRYLINNANFESYLHVVKTDSTTGKTIPYAGAGFQIYASRRQPRHHELHYPTLTVIDTFYTNENGYAPHTRKAPITAKDIHLSRCRHPTVTSSMLLDLL